MFVKAITLGAFVAICLTGQASGFIGINDTTICCNGDLGNITTMDCCGKDEIYDVTKDICCGGQLEKDVSYLTNYSCCYLEASKTQKAYNFFSEVCCPGSIVKKENVSKDYGCCGSDQLFDYELSFCCGDRIVDKANNQACCDTTLYDNKKQICITNFDNGTVTYKLQDVVDNKDSMCDKEAYDSSKNACCWDGKEKSVIVANEKGIKNPSCCISYPKTSDSVTSALPVVYDGNSQTCCDGTIVDIPKELLGSGVQCCGLKVISFDQVCCDNEVREGQGECCGDKVASYEQTCCDKKVYPERGICCDNTFTRGENLFCCDGKSVQQSDKNDLGCCQTDTGELMYNNVEMLCCDSKVLPKTSDSQECCYSVNKPYDTLKENCGFTNITLKSQSELDDIKNIIESCGPSFRPRREPIVYY